MVDFLGDHLTARIFWLTVRAPANRDGRAEVVSFIPAPNAQIGPELVHYVLSIGLLSQETLVPNRALSLFLCSLPLVARLFTPSDSTYENCI